MLDFPRWKVIATILACLCGVLYAIPSLVPEATLARVAPWASEQRFNLGLDLSGGSHILLEADTQDVVRTRLAQMEEDVRSAMRRASPAVEIGDISTTDGRLSFMVRDVRRIDAAREAILPLTSGAGLTGQRDWNIEVRDSTRFVLTPTQAGIDFAIDQAIQQATEVVRRRIDELGTRGPTIIRQGADRIVVQVPGLQNPEALKALLGRTAKLEFKLVDLQATPEQVQAGRAPVGSQILPMQDGGRIAVKRRAIITGDRLNNATVGFDEQNLPAVTISFDGQGARQFARVTQDNVDKPFAIILDGQVLSAPSIRQPILGGTATISGSFTTDSANQLAIALRSGALPVTLRVIEERTVGPDLGADSIRAGTIASIVATAAVIAFMLATYGRFGVYATVALVLNAFLILGILAFFRGTLTLPGIAGFVLTIGAAVDANVLINERIREERRGRGPIQAVEMGYKEAQSAIFDANITNVIAAALMFYFGSGPIRGFAVILGIGIVTSVFTAVTVTRLIVAQWLRAKRPTALVL